MMINANKLISAIIVSVCVSTFAAAAKAYVDVERLKVRVMGLIDYAKETRQDVKETRQDVKDIKTFLLKGE